MNEEHNPAPAPLARVARVVDLTPIPDKDRIELATVDGYHAVVEKGAFRLGELIAFVEPDTLVPVDAEHGAFAFRAPDAKADADGVRWARTRTRRFGQAWSRGLVIKLDAFGTLNVPKTEGSDLTEILGLRKYGDADDEPVSPFAWPSEILAGIEKTSEPRINSSPGRLSEFVGRTVAITLKIDGMSCTVAKPIEGDPVICSRNTRIGDEPGDVEPAKVAIFRRVGAELLDKLPAGYAVQAEIAGPGIQKNRASFGAIKVLAFRVFRQFSASDAWEELPFREARGFLADRGIEGVPVVSRGLLIDGRYTVADFERMAQTSIGGFPAEGIVVTTETPARDRVGRRLSFKVINPEYEART